MSWDRIAGGDNLYSTLAGYAGGMQADLCMEATQGEGTPPSRSPRRSPTITLTSSCEEQGTVDLVDSEGELGSGGMDTPQPLAVKGDVPPQLGYPRRLMEGWVQWLEAASPCRPSVYTCK